MALVGVFIALSVGAAIFFFWLMSTSKTKEIINKIPGPPTIPIFGNAHLFKRGGVEFYNQIQEYCREYGADTGIFRCWIGPHPSIVITRAPTVEAILCSSKHLTKSVVYNCLKPWLRTGLLTSTGEKWHARRKLLTPTFHFKILEDFLQVFNEQSQIMVAKLDKQVGTTKFDINPFIALCALDIICDTAMGKHVNAQANSESEYVIGIYKISEIIMERFKAPWMWPEFIFNRFPVGKEHNKHLKVLHDFTRKVIRERSVELNERLKRGEKIAVPSDDTETEVIGTRRRLAFLDLLLEAARDNETLDEDDICEEVDTFMFEGHDTTAAAVSWAVYLIGAYPKIQQKLQAEVDEVFGGACSDRAITMDDIRQLKYMECVIKESLRLYPSVPIYAREISEDCNVGGYMVPKGATAIIITPAVHSDEKHFPDSTKFDPDRWLPENSIGRHPYCYIPFSAGPRNCIGQKFALQEEKILLSYILRQFNITSLDSREDLRPNGELILRSEMGIMVHLEHRQK